MYYEDFELGSRMVSGPRTITVEDLDAFISLSGLDNPIFMEAEGAVKAVHDRRIVPAPFQLSAAMGLAQGAGWFDRVVAVLEFTNLKFKKTVHPGDTLTLAATALSKRPTSRPERGIVVLEYEMTNQERETVMTGQAVYLMRRVESGG